MRRAAVLLLVALTTAACFGPFVDDAPTRSEAPLLPLAPPPVEPPAPEPSPAVDPPAEANAPDPEPPPRPAREPIGPFEQWVREFSAASAPETFQPPRLRKLADAKDVPRATIVFQRGPHLVRLDLPSGHETRLTGEPGYASSPVWTEDGDRFFFLSNARGAVRRTYFMREGDTTPHEVGPAMPDGARWAVSRDGRRVAHATPRGEGATLVVTDVADGATRRFAAARVDYLAFSAGGDALYTVRETFGEAAVLLRIDAVTGAERRIPTPPVHELVRPWDRGDGSLFVVASEVETMLDRAPSVFRLAENGGPLAPVGRFSVPIGYLTAVLSHDKRRFAAAWSQRQGGFGAAFHEDVTILDATSGAVVAPRLTKMFPRPFFQAHEPSWLPDGRHLVLTLAVCARGDCRPEIRSVVLVDAERPDDVPVFLAEGGSAAARPVP